jgi:hypothetical protein
VGEDETMSSVGIEFPKEQARARSLLDAYRSIGPAGAFGAANIEATLAEADKAMASHDPVATVRAFAALKALE